MTSRDDVGSNEGSSSARASLTLDKACAETAFPEPMCPSKIAKSHVENGAVNGERLRTRSAAAQILVGIALRHVNKPPND